MTLKVVTGRFFESLKILDQFCLYLLDLKTENSTAAAKYMDEISSRLETISALKSEIESISIELIASKTRADELQAQLACEGEMRKQIELVLAENKKLTSELEVILPEKLRVFKLFKIR